MTTNVNEADRTVNEPLLRKVLDHITAHPEEWNQALWGVRTPCGTAFCVAGHALNMSGATFEWSDEDVTDPGEGQVLVTANRTSPSGAAAEVLGLDRHRDGDLFSPLNTMRTLYRHANRLTDGAIAIPDELPDGS